MTHEIMTTVYPVRVITETGWSWIKGDRVEDHVMVRRDGTMFECPNDRDGARK